MKWFVKHKVLVLFVVFISCFSIGFIISFNKSHEIEIKIDYDNEFIIDNVLVEYMHDGETLNEGNFDILSINNELGKTTVKLKAKAAGKNNIKVSCIFKANDVMNFKILSTYTNVNDFNMIFLGDKLTDYISIRYLYYSFSVLIGILSILSLLNFIFNLKKNMYTQKTILNGAMFFFLAIIFSIYSIAIVYTAFHYEAIDIKLLSLVTSNVMAFSVASSIPYLFIYALVLIISNIKLFTKEGVKLKNSLGLIFSGMMITGLVLMAILLYLSRILYVNNLVLSILYSIGSALYVLFESILFSTIICSIYVTKKKIDSDIDYVIILGCKIAKDGSLLPLIKGRVDRAISLYNNQINKSGKKLTFVPSGGKGNDEIIAEADAMNNYLISQGIPKSQILVENKSTNTLENFKFSKKLIDKDCKNKDIKIVFSTTNYHMFRSGLIAKQVDLDINGIGSKTKWYFWPNAFTREIVGIFMRQSKKQIFILLLITVSAGLSAFIYTII